MEILLNHREYENGWVEIIGEFEKIDDQSEGGFIRLIELRRRWEGTVYLLEPLKSLNSPFEISTYFPLLGTAYIKKQILVSFGKRTRHQWKSAIDFIGTGKLTE